MRVHKDAPCHTPRNLLGFGFRHLCLPVLRRSPALVTLYLSGAVSSAAGHAALAWAGAQLLRALFAPSSPALPSAATLSLVGLVAALFKAGGAAALAYADARLAADIASDVRERIALRLFAPHACATAATTMRIVGAVRTLERAVVTGLFGSFRALLQLLPLLALALAAAPPLALLALAALVPFIRVLSILRRFVRRGEREALAHATSLEEHLDEIVRHADVWRTYGAGARVREALRKAGKETGTWSARAATARAGISGGNEALGALAVAVAVLVFARGEPPAGDALVFFAVLFSAYRPLRDLGDARAAAASGEVALDALAPWLVPAEPSEELDQHAFRGEPRPLALDSFGASRHSARCTLHVPPGALVAIVGPTGAGKTTLLRAMLGLEPAAGVLRYDGRELGEGVGPATRPFAWVPQEAPLVAGTLSENVALGAPEPHRAWSAFLLLHGRAVFSPDERVGAPGCRSLSGGERAWVAIARAVATEQPVILLDEPTASLDVASEMRVVALLEGLRGRRTLVVVTHKPALAALADIRFVLSLPTDGVSVAPLQEA